MKRWFVPGMLAVMALALALRLPNLTLRPMHNDEAVNAMKFRALWTENRYTYNPDEFHGPTLAYFTLPAAWLNASHDFNDFSEATYRIVTVCFGVGLIVVLLLLTPELGRAETWWASLFAALSPAMVFYSRYYIHEMLLVFFTALAAMAWWRYCRNGRFGWCVLAGAGLGLTWATKETFVLAILSMTLALFCAAGWIRWRGGAGLDGGARCGLKSVAAALGIAVAVAILFFSSFFTNPSGLVAAIKTYGPWLHRAAGVSPHEHPWDFYFQRLLFYRASGGPVWSEGLIAGLAAVGFAAGLAGRCLGPANIILIRIIAFYTLWMTLIYTVMPYKTPWCLLGFWHGTILLAGVGAAALLRWCKAPGLKVGMAILLTAATAQLGWQAWRGNFAVDKGGVPYCDSAKNPYVYSQTVPDVFRLMRTMDGLAQVSPAGYGTVVEVMSPESYWPLPWCLRRFEHAGYWDKIPAQPPAPIMIVSTALHAGFDQGPARTHVMAGYFELRPNVFFELYVSTELWARYVKTSPAEKD
ncbi:MAG: flippase activity-associated protein Agl23 [Verrucomicrobiota bacterium]|jgi:uncharacterized protein (TIGR03663 family)